MPVPHGHLTPKQTEAAFERPIFYLPVTPRHSIVVNEATSAPAAACQALDVNRDLLATMCAPERRESIDSSRKPSGRGLRRA
jgi:hypothetical protein